jgi:hypothetical protein
MARNRTYRRLPGRGRGIATYHTLWLGPGHLLLVESSGYREIYTRVELADVQSVTIRRTNTMFVRVGVTGFLFLVLLAAAAASAPELRVFWVIPAGLVLAFSFFDLLFGPSCSAEVRTPIQNLRLRSIRRLRVARVVMNTLRPLIEQAQGTVTADQVRDGLADIAPLPEAASSTFSTGLEQRRGSTSPLLHTVLAALLVVEIPLSLLQTARPENPWLTVVAFLMFLIEIGVALAAIVRQGKLGPSKGHRVWVWLTFFFLLATMIGGIVYGVVIAMSSAAGEPPFSGGLEWASGLFVIGVAGLLAYWVVLELRRRRAEGSS